MLFVEGLGVGFIIGAVLASVVAIAWTSTGKRPR